MIKKVHHSSILVTDLEKSLDFYKSIGFEVVNTFEKDKPKAKAAYIQNGGGIMELWQFEDATDPEVKIIKKHIAFETDNLEEDLKMFNKHGYETVKPITKGVTVKAYAFVKDGEENYFELIQPK